MNNRYKFLSVVLFVLIALSVVSFLHAQSGEPIDSQKVHEIYLLQNDLESIKVYSLSRVAISNPDITDIVNVTDQELLLVGKTPGQTMIFIWDEYGKRQLVVNVFGQDLDRIKERIARLLAVSKIEGIALDVNKTEGKIVVVGKISDELNAKVNPILAPFSGYLMNMLDVIENEDLIEIEAQISELNTSLTESLGIDWTSSVAYRETVPTFDGSLGDLFKIGDFTRSTQLVATVNALITEGKGRVLSRPKLVVKNGEQASFLVGGQIPIQTRTTTSTTGASSTITDNITYQSYGVSLTITPTIKKEKIDVELSVDVSDIDAANSSGGQVAFTTRNATTSLYLNDGQTIVMAGLIKQNKGETVKKIPFVGDIPIVGMLFRSKTISPVTSTEMVVSLTPTILRQSDWKRKDSDETETSGEKSTQTNTEEDNEPSDEIAETATIEPKEDMAAMADPSTTAAAVDAVLNTTEQASSSENAIGLGASVHPGESSSAPATTSAGGLMEEATRDTVTGGQPSTEAIPSMEDDSQAKADVQSAPVETSSLPVDTAIEIATKEGVLKKLSSTEVNSDEVVSYVKMVQQRIAKAATFPYEAKEKGWEGTVRLKLHLLSDGTLREALIKESSGQSIFDTDALNTAQILAPYPSFPPELKLEELIITIPIIYSQKLLSGETVCLPDDKKMM